MPPAERFNWLHLTDLHFGQSGQSPLWPNVRGAFFEDLKRLHERAGPWNAVLFTGDFVQAGKADEFKAMEAEVLVRLWEELGALGSGDAVLLGVPGNHDLVRPDEKKKPPAAVRLLLKPGALAELEEEFWSDPDNEYVQAISSALANYQDWWNKTPRRCGVPTTNGILPGDFATTLKVGSRRVGVVGLNTTFLQLTGGDFRGRLAWDVRQLHAACGGDALDWCKRHDVSLLLTHQGPEWLDARSRDEIYPEINPAGRFAAHLFGHMHETVVRATSYGGGKPLRQWQGCSLFGMEKYGEPPQKERRHGYGAGRIEIGARETTIRFWPRLGVKDANGWRFVPHEESCILGDDGGTEPETVSGGKKARASRSKAAARSTTGSTSPTEVALLAAYTKAARALWDIIDLAGLPEDDRHLAMQRFVLRELYLPLRMVVEEALKEEALTALEERRESARLSAAGRGRVEQRKEAFKRVSLGDWLQTALETNAVPSNPRLVILGDPGSGKTTLLRWLATACLLRREGDPDFARLPDSVSLPTRVWLPILIRCRELDKARLGQGALEDLLRQTLAKMELPGGSLEALVALLRSRLEAGSAILLVDGLDEITDPGLRAAFCGRLEAVAKRYPAAPILATSRIVGYREMRRRLGEGFAHATLAELSPEEKDDFIRRWCEITIPDLGRRETEVEKLRRGIHGSDRIERLTTNPMLLTTMALVQRKVGKLPTRRHKLYWEAVGVLLNWRGEVEEPMDPDEALPQLEYVAYAMCDRGVQRLRRDELVILLEAVRKDYPNIRPVQRQEPEAFLTQLERRTGLLVEVGEVMHSGKPVAVYEFRHLTFQEYLAALALLEGRFPCHRQGSTLADRVRPLAGRLVEVPAYRTESEYLVTENWREAIRLCVASCNDDDVHSTLQAVLEPERPEETRPRAILALLCLADEPNVSQRMADQILQCFANQVREGDGLGSISTGIDRAAMEAAGSVWGEPLRAVLLEEFIHREPEQRTFPGGLSAMISVSAIPASEAGQSEWMALQTTALASASESEAGGAALAIMDAAFKGVAVMVPGLVDRLVVLLGGEPASAHAAAFSLFWLAGGFRGEGVWAPRSTELRLLHPYLSDSKGDPEALLWLMKLFEKAGSHEAVPACVEQLRSPHLRVRVAAVRTLGEIKDPAAVARLRDVLGDGEVVVRVAAAQALGQIKGPAAVAGLMDALGDEKVEVRVVVARALGEIKDPAAVARLRDVLGDGEVVVRVAAAQALGQIKDPAAVAGLMDALGDEKVEVRVAVAQALGQIKDPAAVARLMAALNDEGKELRESALGALVSEEGDQIDKQLLSRQLVEWGLWLDPLAPISAERALQAAQELSLPEEEIRRRYEKLAAQYGLSLTWR